MARVVWGVDEDKSRYEIACFDGPELDEAGDRAALLEMMERRIGGSPGARVTARESTRVGELTAVEIRLSLPEDRVGRYLIFLVDHRRLFEVSVVGPAGARLSAGAERFFQSFRLEPSRP
jgi:hypothetical protein